MNSASIVSRVWSFCTTLRDDGVGYGDYLEQLTYLIFLKMADEYATPPYNRDVGIPLEYAWQSLKQKRGAELKGDIYEGLLEKNAEDTKSGAGQYFTPRALIRAMIECVRPDPGKTLADPACGTGGFFLAAYDFITNPGNYQLDKQQKAFLKHSAIQGNEIVANTRRLCLMNMFLHNIGEIDGAGAVSPNDALVAASGQSYDYVLANPPFGKK